VALVGLALAAIARHVGSTRAESVARACHELRGPLTTIRLGLELAKRAEAPPVGRLRAIELELARAALALEDLSAAAHGRRSTGPGRSPAAGDLEPVDVAELLADLAEAFRPAATAAGVELRPPQRSGPLLVIGQRLRLAQATGNLIANAIEHGGGVVEVGLRVDPDRVWIEVVDGGAGLRLPVRKLTARGGLWPSARARAAGRGHGLAVASSVARAHGGRLATAPSDRGARVMLELPRGHAVRPRASSGA
jgi:signal transduction histidine kinase